MGRNLHRKQTLVYSFPKNRTVRNLFIIFATLFIFANSYLTAEDSDISNNLEMQEIMEPIILPDVPQIYESEHKRTTSSSKSAEPTDQSEISQITPNKNAADEENESIDTQISDFNETNSDSEDNSNSISEKNSENTPKIEKIELPFDGMDRPEVEKFRQMYLSPKWSKLLCTYLERAMDYRLYVRKSINDKELPEILEYLPVVESNYKTNAKSSSGAIGLWQFMANSVEPFLTLNDYVDERFDPWKSTDAALRKLTDNYNYFKDWLIAIGAYNCGMGAMNRALKKCPEKSFWALVDNGLIPGQTANYVPKLLAIADLAINSEYYGLNIPNHNEEYELLYNERNAVFDYVTVSRAYSISQIAQEMRIDTTTLKSLNPSYILGFTHPSRNSEIRIPLGMAHAAEEAIKNISPIEFPFKYKVEAGDSLWSISRKYGVSIDAICELNGIQENAILRIGKILYIPSK